MTATFGDWPKIVQLLEHDVHVKRPRAVFAKGLYILQYLELSLPCALASNRSL
jgi:hypothetical protein